MTDIDKLIQRLEDLRCDCPKPQKKTGCSIHRETDAAQALRELLSSIDDRDELAGKRVEEIAELKAENEKLRAVYEAAKAHQRNYRPETFEKLCEALAAIDSPTEETKA